MGTVLILALVGLVGCDQREDPNNPFFGPNGAAVDSPFGQRAPAAAPAATRADLTTPEGPGHA